MTLSIALAAISSALLLLLEHYALLSYTRHVARREMPFIVRYVLGTLALNGALVMLFWLDPKTNAANAIIWVTAISGLAVLLAYAVDWVVESLSQWREESELRRAR